MTKILTLQHILRCKVTTAVRTSPNSTVAVALVSHDPRRDLRARRVCSCLCTSEVYCH